MTRVAVILAGWSSERPVSLSSGKGMAEAAREYAAKIRGGDVGALPAILGLIVLALVFTALKPGPFTGAFNFANLINQGAGVIVIAMGLVFVLLLGEIDLSAGYTAGTAAATMGVVVTRHDWPWWAGIIVCLATGAFIGLLMLAPRAFALGVEWVDTPRAVVRTLRRHRAGWLLEPVPRGQHA